MKRIIISVAALLVISTGAAFIFWDKETLTSFLKCFLIAAAVQFVIQYFLNQFLNAKYGVEVTKLEIALAKEMNQNVKELTCPCYLKNVQSVQLDINQENKYTCNKCNREIAAVVEVSTAMCTTPIAALKAEIPTEILTTPSTNE